MCVSTYVNTSRVTQLPIDRQLVCEPVIDESQLKAQCFQLIAARLSKKLLIYFSQRRSQETETGVCISMARSTI